MYSTTGLRHPKGRTAKSITLIPMLVVAEPSFRWLAQGTRRSAWPFRDTLFLAGSRHARHAMACICQTSKIALMRQASPSTQLSFSPVQQALPSLFRCRPRCSERRHSSKSRRTARLSNLGCRLMVQMFVRASPTTITAQTF